MNSHLTVSQSGIDLIKRFEGCHSKNKKGTYSSYRCPAGRWTIGYGHVQGVRSGQKITEGEAAAFLVEDLKEAEEDIRRLVHVPLTGPQFDALVSFEFNVGDGNFRSSTLLKKLNSGDYSGAAAELMRWDKATVNGNKIAVPGLTRRRAAEAQLFLLEEPLGEVSKQPQKVEATSVKSLKKSRTMAGTATASAGVVLAETASNLEGLVSYSDTLRFVFIAVSLAGIALATYARWDANRKGEY